MSKNSFLDKIEVKSPCSQDWEEMRGSDQVRFCGHCDLNVNNLSAMTRKEALKIVREADGRICVRYVKNPETNAPVFAGKLYQIGRRTGIAAGVVASALTFSSLTHAQGGVDFTSILKPETEVSQSKKSDKNKTDGATASIFGTLTDQNGNFVPNTSVLLLNQETNESRSESTNNKGFYEFKDLASGTYKLKTDSQNGFAEIENIEIGEGSEKRQDVLLSVHPVVELPVDVPELKTVVLGGAMFSVSYREPLFQAVYEDNLEETKNLIAKGESVNAKDKNYNNITPLFLAVENGNLAIVEILLNFGAKVNAKDANKQTPLMRLDSDATPELVNLLIKHGAKVNLTDNEGNTALMFASSYADAEVLRALIVNGANVNAQNKNGRTALMNAIEEENLENVRALILAGADVNLENKEGETAWDLTSDEEVKKLLGYYGAKVKDN